MTRPSLSVLMPVYNGERYLPAALESILGQTFREFELVVVDDGSTDRSPHILASCCDARVKLFRIPHVGLVAALNEGLVRCSGEVVARMDADDRSDPARLALQWEYLQDHGDVDMVTCECNLIDDEGVIIGRTLGGVGADMILELAGGNGIIHGSIMVRRKALPPAPVYVGPAEDYRLWARMVRDGRRFACVGKTLYEFRTHDQRYSLTHARSQSAGILDVQWPLLEECERTRNLGDAEVRWSLAVGWGRLAGAAYCAGEVRRGDAARQRFLDVAGVSWDDHLATAVDEAIEAMIWGGCPWRSALRLRWLQWRRRPTVWASYRNLALSLPGVQRLRTMLRRGH